jgi:hypothetical protein
VQIARYAFVMYVCVEYFQPLLCLDVNEQFMWHLSALENISGLSVSLHFNFKMLYNPLVLFSSLVPVHMRPTLESSS